MTILPAPAARAADLTAEAGAAGRRLLVCDVDGTIVDSAALLLEAQRRVLARFRLPHPGREAGLAIVGLSLVEAFEALLPASTRAAAPPPALAEAYRDEFHALRGRPEWAEPLYPGAAETLRGFRARGVRLGIATGKSRRGVARLLEGEGWSDLFATVQTADDAPSKPHPAMLLQALADAGVAREQAAMIGDSVHDARMARAAGVAMIGVAWGFQPPALLEAEGAAMIVQNWAEVPAAFDALVTGSGHGSGSA